MSSISIYHSRERERGGRKWGACPCMRHYTYSFILIVPETRRPPWLDPDPQPADLENARKALLYEHNPNQPHSPDKLRAERLGLSTRPLHRRSHTAPAHVGTEKVSVDK